MRAGCPVYPQLHWVLYTIGERCPRWGRPLWTYVCDPHDNRYPVQRILAWYGAYQLTTRRPIYQYKWCAYVFLGWNFSFSSKFRFPAIFLSTIETLVGEILILRFQLEISNSSSKLKISYTAREAISPTPIFPTLLRNYLILPSYRINTFGSIRA